MPLRVPAVEAVRRRAPRADHRHRASRARAARHCGPAGSAADDSRRALDDAPDRRRRRGHRRLLHVHDRVHRRQRHRRPGLGLPAQQRADGLRLRPRPRPTAPRAASARAARWRRRSSRARQAGAGRRLAGRVDDHHHRPAGAARAARARQEPAGGDRGAARVAAQHGTEPRRGGVQRIGRRGCAAAAPYDQSFGPSAEIGAITGIEFLPWDRLLAAAEPVRRGGGSAMVVKDR